MIMLGTGSSAASHDVEAAAGPQARHIAELFNTYLGVSVAVAVAVIVSVLACAWFRRRHESDAPTPALSSSLLHGQTFARELTPLDDKREARHMRRVIASSVATIVALCALMTESILADNALQASPLVQPLEIDVTGQQWWWLVHYRPDTSGRQAFDTANELHVPVGRSILLHLMSTDVIHSFWAPSLHGKRDLIPGEPTALGFRVDRAGSYRVQCAEFCGQSHAHMALSIVAESSLSFEAWRAHQLQPAQTPGDANARRGQRVFLSSGCPLCHSVSGTSALGHIGPDLTHLQARRDLGAAELRNTKQHLAALIRHADQLKPDNRMPSIALPHHDESALLSYLESLR